jgi:hypothetical protein
VSPATSPAVVQSPAESLGVGTEGVNGL